MVLYAECLGIERGIGYGGSWGRVELLEGGGGGEEIWG